MRFYMLDTLGETNDRSLCILHDSVHGIGMGDVGLHTGERVGAEYPKDAKIYMSKRNPGIKLSSLLGNTNSFLIVSRDFKEAVEKLCGDSVEYLPFTLYDHRKRVYSKDYFILNPLGSVDCLDLKKSEIEWDDEDPDDILHIEEYVIDRKKAKKLPQLFRVDKEPTTYVVGLKLAQAVYDGDFTNVLWTELRFTDEV